LTTLSIREEPIVDAKKLKVNLLVLGTPPRGGEERGDRSKKKKNDKMGFNPRLKRNSTSWENGRKGAVGEGPKNAG